MKSPPGAGANSGMPTSESDPLDEILHPPTEPTRCGRLRVSPRHELYWETIGRSDGIPVIVLHGGPGGGCSPVLRRFFDPERFHVLLFDQRGAGRSTPLAEWKDNSTADLVEDIDRLRAEVGFERPSLLFGGSWGSTLALAYAQSRPDLVRALVLRGVFLARRRDIDHLYHGGTAAQFPENFARLQALVPEPGRFDYPEQLFRTITEGREADRRRALLGWARYELRMSELSMTEDRCERLLREHDPTAFSTLENHYMRHRCFLGEGQLLREADRIVDLPVFLVTGRFDVICPPAGAWELASRLRRVRVEIPQDASHSYREPSIARALLDGLDWAARAIRSSRGD